MRSGLAGGTFPTLWPKRDLWVSACVVLPMRSYPCGVMATSPGDVIARPLCDPKGGLLRGVSPGGAVRFCDAGSSRGAGGSNAGGGSCCVSSLPLLPPFPPAIYPCNSPAGLGGVPW